MKMAAYKSALLGYNEHLKSFTLTTSRTLPTKRSKVLQWLTVAIFYLNFYSTSPPIKALKKLKSRVFSIWLRATNTQNVMTLCQLARPWPASCSATIIWFQYQTSKKSLILCSQCHGLAYRSSTTVTGQYRFSKRAPKLSGEISKFWIKLSCKTSE